MVFVDTSVWIDYLRGRSPNLPALVDELNSLLDEDRVALAAPVWIELLSGAKGSDLSRMKRVFSALPRYLPSTECWSKIEDWVDLSSRQGHRFGFGDLLIASIAAEAQGEVWSLDADFRRMSKLKLVRAYVPRG